MNHTRREDRSVLLVDYRTLSSWVLTVMYVFVGFLIFVIALRPDTLLGAVIAFLLVATLECCRYLGLTVWRIRVVGSELHAMRLLPPRRQRGVVVGAGSVLVAEYDQDDGRGRRKGIAVVDPGGTVAWRLPAGSQGSVLRGGARTRARIEQLQQWVEADGTAR